MVKETLFYYYFWRDDWYSDVLVSISVLTTDLSFAGRLSGRFFIFCGRAFRSSGPLKYWTRSWSAPFQIEGPSRSFAVWVSVGIDRRGRGFGDSIGDGWVSFGSVWPFLGLREYSTRLRGDIGHWVVWLLLFHRFRRTQVSFLDPWRTVRSCWVIVWPSWRRRCYRGRVCYLWWVLLSSFERDWRNSSILFSRLY